MSVKSLKIFQNLLAGLIGLRSSRCYSFEWLWIDFGGDRGTIGPLTSATGLLTLQTLRWQFHRLPWSQRPGGSGRLPPQQRQPRHRGALLPKNGWYDWRPTGRDPGHRRRFRFLQSSRDRVDVSSTGGQSSRVACEFHQSGNALLGGDG